MTVICNHRWMKVYEESILGGSFSVGWECEYCHEYVDNSKVTPAGLGGTIGGKNKLRGPHGGRGNTADGRVYKYQIIHEDGTLEIVRP